MASGGGFSLGRRQSAGRGRVPYVGVALATTFVLASALAPLANAQQCGVWLPAPSGGASLLGVTYGGGRYVAVGSEGASTSTDGSAWTPIALSLGGKPLVRVAWNGSAYAAVGSGGAIYTSPDGSAWTPHNSTTAADLAGIAWGAGTWVVVGAQQTILTSPNGTAWTQVHVAGGGYLFSVIWTGTQFVAVGDGGAVFTSATGASWNESAIAGESSVTDVVWTGTQLVAVSFDGTVLTSPSGGSWTPRAETGVQLRRVVWTGGKYIAVGDHNVILGSPDVVAWEPETVDATLPDGSLTGLVWGGSQSIAVGSPSGVLYSSCGIWADFGFTPANPEIGQTIAFAVTKSQGVGRVRWDFGEVGCGGLAQTKELACLGSPCAFATNFSFATSGAKTVALWGWNGEYDGSGQRIFILVRTKTVSVAATGSCSTCLPPSAPTTPSPADTATRPGGEVLLQWTAPLSGTPPFSYDVEFDAGTACAGITATQCQLSAVAESAISHTWRVTAKNACGQAVSPLWHFLACSAPAIPVANFDWLPVGPLPSWPAQQQPYPGQEVAFQDHSSNTPSEWAWSGLAPAGLVSDQAPKITWWWPGERVVGLSAGNCRGWSGETDKTVTVYPDARPRVWAFDFGTDTSPLAPGFVRVTAATAYSPTQAYGWEAGAVTARDRGVGDALVRDFIFSGNATFGVDVPNRTYDVALWMGDATRAHDEMAVYLEGEQKDQVTTAPGEVVLRVYRVAVNDGRLTLRIADLGGADPNAVINGLEIFAGDALRVDFGTPTSPVAVGYRGASAATTFNAPLWCGWSAGLIGDRDRAIGSDLLRDLDFTRDGTFSCAIAPGVWDVTVRIGDATSPHDQMGVFLEGAQVDLVTRSAGQFAVRRYRVRVGDGDLTLRLADQGGNDVNAVIDALDADRVGPFDFGTATSPAAPGYAQVTNTTRYSSATGFGWLQGTVGARDRGVGSDLLRDLNFTTAATFAVDVPNGAYEVTVVMGDMTGAHDQMAILLEGVEVAVVSTAKAKPFMRTFRTTVSDGQLTVRLEDRGGVDANVVINGLSLAPAR